MRSFSVNNALCTLLLNCLTFCYEFIGICTKPTIDKSLRFSKPQFPHLENRAIMLKCPLCITLRTHCRQALRDSSARFRPASPQVSVRMRKAPLLRAGTTRRRRRLGQRTVTSPTCLSRRPYPAHTCPAVRLLGLI